MAVNIIPDKSTLVKSLSAHVIPMTLAWSRLEGRPRTNNFDRALKAEVRDAMWMLCKQWQMGEFRAEDAGSPVTAKISTSNAALVQYQAGNGPFQSFNKDHPFEAVVEQRPLPFATLEQEISLDIRLVMGKRWMQLLKDNALLPVCKQFFLDNYGFAIPDPEKFEDAEICADAQAWQEHAAVAGRMMDGAKFFFDLGAAVHYFDRPGFPAGLDKNLFKKLEGIFTDWYADLFFQPGLGKNDAWEPAQLEYQFSLTAATKDNPVVMHAEAYYQGHLDWYNLDIDRFGNNQGAGNVAAPDPVTDTKTLIPSPVSFEGMPNTRWWAFEDSRVNFSYIKPDTTDLAKLLMIEFGLVYANDWYLLPVKLPVASLTSIRGLALTNSFGENFWIEAAGKGDDADWTRWNMFSMNVDSLQPVKAETDLLLLPTVAKIQEGKPVEEVLFIRDELANMVWGVETIVPTAGSWSKSGFAAADELHAQWQQLITKKFGTPDPPAPVKDGDEEAKIRYELMNTIPENWIPFIPVHVPGNNREVQLQRGAMPRILDGNPDKPDKIRPRTSILQEGLAAKAAYFIHEEEVPRSGIRVEQSFQRTRWNDGKVYVWFGARKTTGRGEGSSGLGFDRILPRKTT